MIVTNEYFKNDIYLPNARKTVTSGVTDVENKLIDFIDEYEQECLLKSLGSKLAIEFFNELDSAEPSLIKDLADPKWDDLLNGTEYVNPDGVTVVWKGIRQANTSLGVDGGDPVYEKSFLANYVYFFYESNAHVTRSGAGNVKVKSANSVEAINTNKAIKSWNKFVKDVQGDNSKKPYSVKSGIFGGLIADYSIGENDFVTLYKFINDQNELSEDTYADFNPKTWKLLNQFGM